MKANLKQTYFWNRRTWGPGEVEIPDGLAIALGLASPTPESGTPDKSAALTLLNSGDVTEIAALPTVGKGAAKRIVEKRPDGGYESLEQAIALNPEISQQPYRVDWEQVRDWEG